MSFKSKLPKRIYKEDEYYFKTPEEEKEKKSTNTTNSSFFDQQEINDFTAESDGNAMECAKEAENAFVEKSTDEEPLHDMKENSIEVDDFDEFLKGDDKNSFNYSFENLNNNNAIMHILSEGEEKEPEFRILDDDDENIENFFEEKKRKNRLW